MILGTPGKVPRHQAPGAVSETLVSPQFVKDHPAQEGRRMAVPPLRPGCCFKRKVVQMQ